MGLKAILAVAAIVLPVPGALAQPPVVHERAGVRYVSGGVGHGERAALEAMRARFNLRLVFAVKGAGAYLADVAVAVRRADGQDVLRTVAQGPWLFAQLAPGRYTLTATYDGKSQTRRVTVPARGHAEAYLYWSDPALLRQRLETRGAR